MPPKRFEGKFGIPPSHPVESLLTQALYRLPESVDRAQVESIANDIETRVNRQYEQNGEMKVLSSEEKQVLLLKLVRHFEDNGESAPINIATCVDALIESPKFLKSDKGSMEKLLNLHDVKTLEKIAEIRKKRAEITEGNAGESNPYENLFETKDGTYYLVRLLNMPHLEEESEYMRHCVGTSTSYVNKMKRGEVEIFSFRDSETDAPVVTIEYDTKGHRLLQVKAVSDRIPTLADPFAENLIEAIESLDSTVSDSGDKRTIRSNEVVHMRQLLALKEKTEKKKPFTHEELMFLYEVHEPIQCFDADRDPLIERLIKSRNREEDIQILCDCPEEYIATTQEDITLDTQVFCNDTGTKISFVDFREAKNEGKLSRIVEVMQKLKEIGSPAQLDVAVEGGIFAFDINAKLAEAIKTFPTAKQAFENADNKSPSWVWPAYEKDLKDQYESLTHTSLEYVVISHGQTTPAERKKLVADMDTAGYRTATLSELMALGIIHPEINKIPDKYFNTLKEYSLVGRSRAPFLRWADSKRRLDAIGVADVWYGLGRFLFVRK